MRMRWKGCLARFCRDETRPVKVSGGLAEADLKEVRCKRETLPAPAADESAKQWLPPPTP